MSKPAAVDLQDDQGSNKPAAAASASKNNFVIDLCDWDPKNSSSTSSSPPKKSPRKRNRSAASKHASIRSSINCQDAIVIDVASSMNSTTTATKEEQDENIFRQALGPFRMDFCPFWRSRRTKLGLEHYFAKEKAATHTLSRNLYRELLEYKLNLPINCSSSIFVRAQESRLDLLRVLITGPEQTPYHHGCFFFDLYLADYPTQAPKVQFLTTANGTVRFNPNLYNNGKVCLSLLGTWTGPGWQPNKSTILQVLVSIQGLILVPEPYFNEPGMPASHKTQSKEYTHGIRNYTVRHALDTPLQQVVSENFIMPEFSTVVFRHFAMRASAIREQLDDWYPEFSSKTSTSAKKAKTSSTNYKTTNMMTKNIVERIRKNLALVEERYQSIEAPPTAASHEGSSSNPSEKAMSSSPDTVIMLD